MTAGHVAMMSPGTFTHDLLAGLPAPAARYLSFALSPGQRPLHSARIAQSGTFLMRPPDGWAPFTAVERFTADPPSFVWDARIRMAPFVAARVRDSYLAGEGSTLARVGGLLTLADLRGTPEMATAALLRWLAEAVWMPTALLPSDSLVWLPGDDVTCRVAITDHGITVSIGVDVSERGEIMRVAADRYRDVGGVGVLTPWVGWFRDYERVSGLMIPMECEVAWMADGGAEPYFRGRIDHVEYDGRASHDAP